MLFSPENRYRLSEKRTLPVKELTLRLRIYTMANRFGIDPTDNGSHSSTVIAYGQLLVVNGGLVS